jgi:tRNA-2-methylthio-N6-dimethylallyladenosine synthase
MTELMERALATDSAPAARSTEDQAGKTVHIKTYGCQMNVYDSERMEESLRALGYGHADTPEEADVIVLNTCHIREKAAEKVYSEVGRLRDIKAERRGEGKRTSIVVAGCVAQAEGAEIQRRAPTVDLVVGPQSYHRLPELLERAQRGARHVADTSFPVEMKFDRLPARSRMRTAGPTAFLTVQEGCDKFCTFCVVPYTRGAEASRPADKIIDEARHLVESGVRELTLLGQNVNAYHGRGADSGSWTLARLIAEISALAGLERIRYTTSHPRDMRDDLIEEHGRNAKLMPYLHLPVQSGSNRVLDAMNRRHTADDYMRLTERIRRARPDIALSTDIIVGFPGETDTDFRATLNLVGAVGFAQAYTFKYSPRPGTPAAARDDQVPDSVQAARLAELNALLNSQRDAFNERCVGATMPVLLEKPGRKSDQLVGRSPYLQAVHIETQTQEIGTIVPVRIISAGLNSLGGVIVRQ